MSGTMHKLKTEIGDALGLAAALMRKAQDEDRELTPDERAAVDGHLAASRDLKARLGRLEENDRIQAEIADLLKTTNALVAPPRSTSAIVAPNGRPASLGRQWIESAAFEFFREGRHRGGVAWTSPAVELVAATITTDPASGGALRRPELQAGIIAGYEPAPRVAPLFAPGSTQSGVISWLFEKTATNAAAAVAEGAAKPESALVFEAVTRALAKVATWLPVSEEMLSDVPQMESYIDARLAVFVAIEMDNQVLNGNGTAPNMQGILATPGLSGPVAAGTGESNADAIFRALMTVLAASGLLPDAIVMNPADWAASVLAKDETGRYLGPGMFASLPSPALWGIPAVPTPAIAQGTGLVGAFRTAAQLWTKDAITVQASNSHADYFIRNLVAIRAEQRALLTTYRPSAFATVTGLASGLNGTRAAAAKK